MGVGPCPSFTLEKNDDWVMRAKESMKHVRANKVALRETTTQVKVEYCQYFSSSYVFSFLYKKCTNSKFVV